MKGTQARVSTLLTIVGHWKSPEIAGNGGFSLGKPFPSFQRSEQGRLLAADVGSRPAMNHDIQIEAAPLDVLAQPPVGVGLLHRTAEALR